MSFLFLNRHPELVSGSIAQPAPMVCEETWKLKQVQHDAVGEVP